MHKTYDVKKVGDKYESKSHNFPEFTGVGDTEDRAIKSMNDFIVYYSDNDPLTFTKRIRDRVNSGLECGCGFKLTEKPIGFYKGKI